jgi:hypothetical protein
MKRIVATCLLLVQIAGPAFAWDDETFLDDGTPLRSGPGQKYEVIATIPDGEVVTGVSKSLDADCDYEDDYDYYCHVIWKDEKGYIAVGDMLYLGDDDDDF